MPGLDGVELARVLSRFAAPPRIVFVTAYEDRAVEAFDLQAVDYVVKPVRSDRLGEAVRRAVAAAPAPEEDEDETITVELAGVTRFVRRSQLRYVEAQGDYARLHTADEAHLVRTTLQELEQRWAARRVDPHPPQHPGGAAAHRRGPQRRRPLDGPDRRRGAAGEPPARPGAARSARRAMTRVGCGCG